MPWSQVPRPNSTAPLFRKKVDSVIQVNYAMLLLEDFEFMFLTMQSLHKFMTGGYGAKK